MNTYQTDIPGSCGIGVLFSFAKAEEWSKFHDTTLTNATAGGAGFQIAAFTDLTEKERKAYFVLAKSKKIMYQSPVRRNRNSNNKFFFCVYSHRRHKKDFEPVEPNWPFKSSRKEA